ncbi:hypothetical protein Lser_V15G28341 [Lactuca serriola]
MRGEQNKRRSPLVVHREEEPPPVLFTFPERRVKRGQQGLLEQLLALLSRKEDLKEGARCGWRSRREKETEAVISVGTARAAQAAPRLPSSRWKPNKKMDCCVIEPNGLNLRK